jgi:hypothetical protein
VKNSPNSPKSWRVEVLRDVAPAGEAPAADQVAAGPEVQEDPVVRPMVHPVAGAINRAVRNGLIGRSNSLSVSMSWVPVEMIDPSG